MNIKKYFTGVGLKEKLHNLILKPDVIILGETHTSENNAYVENQYIKEYAPEFILYEGFDTNITPEKYNLLKDKLQTKLEDIIINTESFSEIMNVDKIKKIYDEHISDLCEYIKESDKEKADSEKMAKSEDEYFKIAKQIIEEKGIFPKTQEELMTTPLIYLQTEIFDEIVEKNKKDKYEGFKYFRENNTLTKNEHLLFKSNININSTIENQGYFYKYIFSPALETNSNIVGCDLPKPKFKSREELINFIDSQGENRERAMAESIEKYLDARTTDKPLIMIIGRKHAKGSYLEKLLKEKK